MRQELWWAVGLGGLAWWWWSKREEEAVIDDLLSDTPTSAALATSGGGVMAVDRVAAWEAYAIDAASQFGIDSALILAFIHRESSGIPTARNPTRGVVGSNTHVGLMQIKCSTAKDQLGFRGRCTDLFDPRTNITYGTGYLKYLLDRQAGDVLMALASYFVGPNSKRLRRRSDGSFIDKKVHNYVTSIIDQAKNFQRVVATT